MVVDMSRSDVRSTLRFRTELFLLGALVGYVAFAALSARTGLKVPRLCPFYLITGHSCPLCGLTRALGLFSQGHFREAVTRHPSALLGAMVGVLILAANLLRRARESALQCKEEFNGSPSTGR